MNDTDKNFKINFKCPACKGDQIEAVVKNVTQLSTVTHLGKVDDSICADYGDTSYEDGDEPSEYRCAFCGTLLKLSSATKVENEADLLKWLQDRDMVIED